MTRHQFVICRLGLAVINLTAIFEVFNSTRYKDMKGCAKCRNRGGLRSLEIG